MIRLLEGHVLEKIRELPDNSVHCTVTSPPYFSLRAYGTEPQIWGDGWSGEHGSEPTIEMFIEHEVEIFREVRRVLHPSGTLFLNIGDSYAGSGKGPTGQNGIQQAEKRQGFANGRGKTSQMSDRSVADAQARAPKVPGLKPKDLCLVPWRLAIALQEDGWWVRSVIAWCKKSPMPESVTDRPTNAWEPIFLLTKSQHYFWDAFAVREKTGREMTWEEYEAKTAPGATWQSGGKSNYAGAHKHDGGQAHPLGRNMWNYWILGPEPFSEAHFATFGTQIPDRAIRAGTSEYGCCPTCLEPYRRVISREYVKSPAHGDGSQMRNGKEDSETNGWAGMPRVALAMQPVGWEKSCKCPDTEPVPCTVLDIFAGSGTTLMVADRLHRNAIGIELNSSYAEILRRRVTGDCPLYTELI